MSVIALVNQKGGCSKSTSAVHLSCWLSNKGYKVQLLDADAQRSSSIWLKSMEDKEIPTTVLQSPDELLEQIPELAAQCDYLIIDGPAGLSEASRAILFRADLAVVPCQPTGLDLQSASDAIRLIKQAQSVRGGAPQAAIFISRAVKGTKLLGEAIALLSKSKEAIVLKTVIHQKQAIADTFGQAAIIWDLPGRPATESAREYERLFKEILGMLK
ncbi:AAA family ATPase [Anabaena sp. CCY 0017]|jgi:chromosome partitioning protein|uniref:AAA family ATPase n=1 Tax=Anabaena sp. CCY 0017 TaxID=3103866 RepID=UPI0039C7064B